MLSSSSRVDGALPVVQIASGASARRQDVLGNRAHVGRGAKDLTMASDSAADLKLFLHDGNSVCPFASQPARFAEIDRDHPLDAPRALIRALATPGVRAAVLVAPEVPTDHATAEALAGEMLGLLFFAEMETGVPGLLVEDVIRMVRAWLDDPDRNLQLRVNGIPMVNIAMGPAYSRPQHPRYAPRLCVVLTWLHDVHEVAVHQPAIIGKIRKAMIEREGSMYDGLTFYLPEVTRSETDLRYGRILATAIDVQTRLHLAVTHGRVGLLSYLSMAQGFVAGISAAESGANLDRLELATRGLVERAERELAKPDSRKG